ncbi:hypothetical protein B0J11DRAFT_506066 [Dendryphion nanum]|uniref:Uncharacterized protein n=1 Tax=Dendryphion nanum TaxID=256645 RepID=A0A9P9ILV0_9PLEO|nr:hypothetical protein B0J11DRAFT_506066 [Dendryphion nanum]
MTSPKGVSPSAAAQAGKSLQTSSFFNINSTFTAESSSTPSVLITDHPKITAITENCSGIHFLNLTTEIRNTIYSYALDIECERTPRPMNYINSNKSARAQERSPQSILGMLSYNRGGIQLVSNLWKISPANLRLHGPCQHHARHLPTRYQPTRYLPKDIPRPHDHLHGPGEDESQPRPAQGLQLFQDPRQSSGPMPSERHPILQSKHRPYTPYHFWSDSWQEIMPYHLLPRIVSEMKKKTRENWTLAYYIHTEYGGECAIQPYDTVEHDIFVDIMKRWIGNAPIALRAEVYGKGKSPEYLEWSDQLKSIITSDVKETSIWQGYSEWIHGLYKRGFRQNYGL